MSEKRWITQVRARMLEQTTPTVPYVARKATMLRPPKTKALDEALEKPHAARQDVAQACASMLAQRDLRAGEQALATWRQAAEAVQKEAYVVYDDTNVYCENHSTYWQAAEQGQAFTTWIGERELLTDFDGAPTDEVRMAMELSGEGPRADREGDPSAAVPDLPEMPVLGE